MPRLPLVALLALLAPAALAAQAPRVTPKGDPSVRSDTIYALAVDSAAYPEDDAVFLLDDGIVRLEADGRHTRTYRQVVQILRDPAIENWAEQSFGYSPGHEKLTINWIRVVRPDGSVVSAEPSHVQDADIPAAMGDPVYSDRKVRRVSLGGVAVGTLVDYSYTVEELKPYLPGDFATSWSITTGLPTMRSRFIVDAPADVALRVVEHNLAKPGHEVVKGGRRVRTWAAQNLKTVEPEMFASDSNGVYESVEVALPITWDRIARWYDGLAKDRYVSTPAVDAEIAKVVAGARTRDDSVRAVHRWVAQDFRYVAVSLGMGGYQPRPPAEVLEKRYGDCKDKATLFITALRRMGIDAYPVLLAAGGNVDRAMPSIGQLDHVIAAVPRDGGYTYVDLTAELTPFGTLPWGPQGEFGLVVHPDGHGEEVTLTRDPMDANESTTLIVGELAPDGTFSGRIEEWSTGIKQYGLRGLFAEPLDSTTRANLLRGVPQKVLGVGAVGDSIEYTNGKDLGVSPRLVMRVHGWRAISDADGVRILTIPFSGMAGAANVAASLEAAGPRRFPIDTRAIFGWGVGRTEMRITLPEGWTARLPKSVREEGVFGRYAAEFTQEGRELRIVRRVGGAEGILPPERIGDLVSWFRALSKDDAKYIVLEAGESR